MKLKIEGVCFVQKLSFYFEFSFVCINFASVKKKIVFVMNPISGTASKRGIPDIIDGTIDKTRFDCELLTTAYAGHGYELAAKAREEGADAVVAIGGDGTVNEVGRALINSQTALGIVPCGSGNGLARHLLLPKTVKRTLEVINRYEIHELDYGTINDHPFFCTCGMGFDAHVSKKFAEAGKRGPITYVENVLREGLKYEPETYEIVDENGVMRYKAFLISCANASQYGNNAYIAPQASMSDGLLDVIIMEPFDVLEAPQISIEMFGKTLDKSSKIKTFRCKHLHINRRKEGVIHFDGDPVMEKADVDVRVHEKGIRVIVNPDADKSQRRPNAVQSAAANLFNEINVVREDITKQTRHIQALSRVLQRKLNL